MILVGRPTLVRCPEPYGTPRDVTMPSTILDGMANVIDSPTLHSMPGHPVMFSVAQDSQEDNLRFLLDSRTGRLHTHWEGVDSDLFAVNSSIELFISFSRLVAENLIVVEECTRDPLDTAHEVESWLSAILKRVDPWALSEPGGSFWYVVLADIGMGNLTLTAEPGADPHLQRRSDGSIHRAVRWVEN